LAGKEFSLCSTCAKRQRSEIKFTISRARECFVCRGLILRIPEMERRTVRKTRRYDFKTFSVGMIIPSEVQEREDQLRSDLQIRGMETIKSQFAREITDFVKRRTGRRVDRMHPELTLLVDLVRCDIAVTAKSLLVHGRYTKPSGVSQRRELCDRCSGRGCSECDEGYARIPSMEEVLGRRFARIFRSSRTKFTWIGSEDIDSVVYLPGRPFIAEVKDPRLRRVPTGLELVTGKGRAHVEGMKVLKGRPASVPPFVFKTRAFIDPLGRVEEAALLQAKKINGALVEYRNNKGKVVYKRVYSVRVERMGKKLVAEIRLDGGLPVKKLVSGESASPSLSELLGIPLACRRFDILRVWEGPSDLPAAHTDSRLKKTRGVRTRKALMKNEFGSSLLKRV
jgi:tRNA pseudouridine synthase 10